MRLSTVLACLAFIWPAAAAAAETPWQELAPGVKARLFADGGERAGLEFDLPEGYKVYWRLAGETGIPTTLDFSASQGLALPLQVDWPIPDIDTTGGYRNYVYHGNVVIPIRLGKAQSGAVLDLAAMMGVCSDICIPASARFTLPLDGVPDPDASLALDLAARTIPIAWDQPAPAFGGAVGGQNGIDLLAPNPEIQPETLIVDAGDDTILFGAPKKSPVEGAWSVPLLGEKGADALMGRTLNLTFMTSLGPYAASVVVSPAR